MTHPPVGAVLQVVAVGPGDVAGAQAGGADLLEVALPFETTGRTPDLPLVGAVAEAASVDFRVVLRLRDDFSTTGGEISRFHGLLAELSSMGCSGVLMGFLDADLRVDVPVMSDLAADIHERGMRWTMHRAFDHVLEPARALDQLRTMPGLDSVLTAGSARGMEHGLDSVCAAARRDPAAASLLAVGGGLRPEAVPWLARAGVRRFRVATAARPKRSWKAYVDAGLVRSWRRLVDAEVAQAEAGHQESEQAGRPSAWDEAGTRSVMS